jgi:hypothetical protein
VFRVRFPLAANHPALADEQAEQYHDCHSDQEAHHERARKAADLVILAATPDVMHGIEARSRNSRAGIHPAPVHAQVEAARTD